MYKIRQIWDQITTFLSSKQLSEWWEGFRLTTGWVKGPVIAVGILILVQAGFYGVAAHSGYGLLVDLLVPVLLAGLGYLFVLIIGGWLARILLKLPPLIWVLIGVGTAVGWQVWGDRTWLHWAFNLALIAGALLVGIAVAGIRQDWEKALLRKKIMFSIFGVVGSGILITIGILFFSPGRSAAPLPVEITLGEPQVDAPDPSLPGNYPVAYLTYGGGSDKHRPEFGEDVDLITDPVDASPYVTYSDWNARLREFFWGFTESDFPLNGRVWYPEGQGPFPLVLIVHGNHNLADFSDAGYQYLGELLASRGFITVSIDQNFLNGGIPGRSSNENDARAWMLLQHVAVWEEWHRDPDSLFYQQVDLENITLIGHSRGGEAAALAATFNHISRYPNNARNRWNYGYGIKAVVGIAPVDLQWLPADHPNPLEDISYLVLQGSHDADLYYFDAIQQYQRAVYTDPQSSAFKSAVYIYRANHGQFNTTWGAQDYPGIRGVFLNRKALLSEEEQQQIAKFFIAAFLEAVIHGEPAYQAIFEDYRAAGDWLPQTGYITQFENFGTRLLADFEEDLDPETITLEEGVVRTSGLSRWREKSPRFRGGDRQDNHAVFLGWTGTQGYYALGLPFSFNWSLAPEDIFVFRAADAREGDGVSEGLDFSLQLSDRHGQRAKIRLSDILPLQTQFSAEISRIPLWNEEYYEDASEPVFQGYRIPLQLFLEDNPNLSLADLIEIRFVFDDQVDGKIFLDDIGFDTD
jgi:dienelactone hydrolase